MINFLALALLLFASTWMLLIPTNLQKRWASATTIEKIKLTQMAINKFSKSNHRLPSSLAELRTFVLMQGISYHPYDAYGRRLSYVPLSASEYYVKSFGHDATENSIGSERDLAIVDMRLLKRIPASQSAGQPRTMQIFPSPLLIGNRPDNRAYFARIITNESNYTKRLIVRGMQDVNFIISAFHENVHEFLWLDNQDQIIFTASGSQRYQDGIYLWNIRSDKTSNVLPLIKQNFFPNSDSFYMAISKVDQATQKAYIFIHPKTNAALNPDNFYRLNKLFVIDYQSDQPTVSKLDAPTSLFEFHISPRDGMKVAPLALQAQKEWHQLQIKGELEPTIVACKTTAPSILTRLYNLTAYGGSRAYTATPAAIWPNIAKKSPKFFKTMPWKRLDF